jgi:heme oxygenase
MPKSALNTLRQRTQSVHLELEELIEDLGLLRSAEGVALHLSTLLLHHQQVAHAVAQPEVRALIVERMDEIAFDLAQLDNQATTKIPKVDLPTAGSSLAQDLGHLYLIEGSRLGAVHIAKKLEEIGIDTSELRSVGGEPPAVRRRWLAFLDRLQPLPEAAWEEAANAAYQSFSSLISRYRALPNSPPAPRAHSVAAISG